MGSILILNAVQMAYLFTWNDQMIMSNNCAFQQKEFLGIMYVLYYMISIF